MRPTAKLSHHRARSSERDRAGLCVGARPLKPGRWAQVLTRQELYKLLPPDDMVKVADACVRALPLPLLPAARLHGIGRSMRVGHDNRSSA